ncbi:efflux RND transporter periplasmic adaptor subunit [Caproiciproducens sp.]|uniref:efflux RND transporter periplasmic adaptor subunit n=1 Tax=Caproiciproducens sp. TaxID=1954376 RepID=UPI0028981F8A|nr:efflux RND transporter periplasmic adaptor subunit [Caproiciproducens sp.]
MKKVTKRVLSVVAVLVIIGLGVGYYFYWENEHFLTTDNAKVTATLYTVVPSASGKLEKLKITQGTAVKQDEIIARIEDGPALKAPVSGQVVKCDVVSGQTVSPATAVAVLADTAGAYVGANIEENNILKVQAGQEVSVKLDAYPGQTFSGHIAQVDQVTQSALKGNTTTLTTSGTYTKVVQLLPVKITLDDGLFLGNIIGTNATVKIRIK